MGQTATDIMKIIERQKHGKGIVDSTKVMLKQTAVIVGENENSMLLQFRDYIVEMYFSEMHPLVVIRLIKAINFQTGFEEMKIINKLNNESLYGSHNVDNEKRYYVFKATQWLDVPLTSKMFYEMLNQYDEEAQKFFEGLEK